MKITDVRCVEYFGALTSDEPFWRERLRRPVDVYPEFAGRGPQQLRDLHDGTLEVRQIFLHVDTDEGITGTTAVLSAEQAHAVLTTLRPVVLGADPLAGERVWDICYRSMIHGRAGTGMLALSALDCALWDIRGQFSACRRTSCSAAPPAATFLPTHPHSATRSPPTTSPRVPMSFVPSVSADSNGSHAGVRTTVTPGWTRSSARRGCPRGRR